VAADSVPQHADELVGLAGRSKSGRHHHHSPTDPLVGIGVVNGDDNVAADETDFVFLARADGDISFAGCVPRNRPAGEVTVVPVEDERPDLPALVILDVVARGGRIFDELLALRTAPVFVDGAPPSDDSPPRAAAARAALRGMQVTDTGDVLLAGADTEKCAGGCPQLALAVFDVRAGADGGITVERVASRAVDTTQGQTKLELSRPRSGTLRLAVSVAGASNAAVSRQAQRHFAS
ncbi:MAG TPA: hypothetical protein VF230_18610, partial [Acidimicrobiales bacterium]